LLPYPYKVAYLPAPPQNHKEKPPHVAAPIQVDRLRRSKIVNP